MNISSGIKRLPGLQATPETQVADTPNAAPVSAPAPAAAAPPTVDSERELFASRGGNTRLFDAVAGSLELGVGPLAPAQVELLKDGLATAATAKSGFNAASYWLSAGLDKGQQSGSFRACAVAVGVDPATLPRESMKAIDEKFSAGMLAETRGERFVDMGTAEQIMRAAIADVASRAGT